MKELFIPYELALLAKQKGFDTEIYFGWYSISKSFSYHNGGMEKPFYDEDVKAPLYQQITDWLREKHKIVVQPAYHGTVFAGTDKEISKFIPEIISDLVEEEIDDDTSYRYYPAWREAIKEGLNLLP